MRGKEEERRVPVRITGLSKRYAADRKISSLSFAVYQQEIFCLLGSQGSGTGAVLKMLLDIVHPESGKIEIFGENIARNPRLKDRISYLSRDYQLPDGYSVEQLITMTGSFFSQVDLDWALDFLNAQGIKSDWKINRLSREKRQLVKLAQVLSNQSDLIILDRPTAGLELARQNQILLLLKELRDRGATVMFSSSQPFEARKIADRTGFFHQGSLLAVRGKEELAEFPGKIIFVPQFDIRDEHLTIPGITGWTRENDRFIIHYQANEDEIIKKLSSLPNLLLKLEQPDPGDYISGVK